MQCPTRPPAACQPTGPSGVLTRKHASQTLLCLLGPPLSLPAGLPRSWWRPSCCGPRRRSRLSSSSAAWSRRRQAPLASAGVLRGRRAPCPACAAMRSASAANVRGRGVERGRSVLLHPAPSLRPDCAPHPAAAHPSQERNVTFSARLTKMETRMYSAFNGVGEPGLPRERPGAVLAGVLGDGVVGVGGCTPRAAPPRFPFPVAPRRPISLTSCVQRRAPRRAPRSWAASCPSAAAATASCRLAQAPRRCPRPQSSCPAQQWAV